MAFKKGNPGKPKGSKNKSTLAFQEALKKHNFDVIEACIYCYTEAKEQYLDYKDRLATGRVSPMEDNSPKFLKIAADMAKDMAGYCHPKLKSIDQTVANAEGSEGFQVTVVDYTLPPKKD